MDIHVIRRATIGPEAQMRISRTPLVSGPALSGWRQSSPDHATERNGATEPSTRTASASSLTARPVRTRKRPVVVHRITLGGSHADAVGVIRRSQRRIWPKYRGRAGEVNSSIRQDDKGASTFGNTGWYDDCGKDRSQGLNALHLMSSG